MRKLQAKDLFSAGRVLREIGLKEEIEKINNKMKNGEKTDTEAVGIELIASVLEKAVDKKCEKTVFEFLASLFEVSAEEVEKMDPVEMLKSVLDVANIEQWKDFFCTVRDLFLKK